MRRLGIFLLGIFGLAYLEFGVAEGSNSDGDAFLNRCRAAPGNPDDRPLLVALGEVLDADGCVELRGKLMQRTQLDLGRKGIRSLELLRSFDHFEFLNLSQNLIVDAAPIVQNKHLRSLYLQHNQLRRVPAFVAGTALEILDLSHNDLTTLRGLAALDRLLQLTVANNELADFRGLEGMERLETLIAHNNEIVNLSHLRGAKQLRNLNVSTNEISSLVPLADAQELRYLILSDNYVSDLKVLGELTLISTLYLDRNPIESLAELASLQGLVVFSAARIPLGGEVTKTSRNCPRGEDVAEVLRKFCMDAG